MDKYFNLLALFILIVFIVNCTYFPKEKIQNSSALPSYKFDVASKSEEILFLALGDWGMKGEYYQKSVAKGMDQYISQNKVDFILTLGDNFYADGVKSVHDNHFYESWKNIYSFHEKLPWYITLGNHDYMGSVDAQIEYGKTNPNWILPYPYYSLNLKSQDRDIGTLTILDTDQFIYLLKIISTKNQKFFEKEKQLARVDEVLKKSNGFKLLAGHHPIYSYGTHGDTDSLKQELLPLLKKHKVTALFSGHEHDMQHIFRDGIHFFICGGGANIRDTKSGEYTLFSKSSPGFLAVQVSPDKLIVSFIGTDENGNYKSLYKADIYPE